SIVSVSRSALPPQVGQATCFQVGCRASGLPGSEKSALSGNRTGRSFSGTGTTPHLAQRITGIGQPQERWRDTPQSRRRYCVVASPAPRFTSSLIAAAIASLVDRPSRNFEL